MLLSLLSQSCPRCCGRWWCMWGCIWRPASGFYSLCLCLACLLSSLCPSSWWWRGCRHFFMPSGYTGKITVDHDGPESLTSKTLSRWSQWLMLAFLFFPAGWSSKINSTVGTVSSFAPSPSPYCPPASTTTAYCEGTIGLDCLRVFCGKHCQN